MAKRFCAHFGSLDNLSQLASMGFTEAGLVWQWDGSTTAASTASAIHNAGIPIATFNAFNDGTSAPSQLGAAGGSYAGYFQALASAGWNCISGEGCGGSVISAVQNYCTYVNYGGIVGSDQANMYASPWGHPGSTGHGHWDYIETYDNSNNLVLDSDFYSCLAAAKSAGAGHLGILIMYGPNGPAGSASDYINAVDQAGCDTICFWCGYGSSSTLCVSLAQQLISHYGAVKDGSGTATAGKSTKAAPVIQCPCRHLVLSFAGIKGSSTSEKLEFEVKINGIAGWVNNNEQWIHGRPYTGELEIWCSNAKKTWSLGKIWPAKDGTFSFIAGSTTAESRNYSVCFL